MNRAVVVVAAVACALTMGALAVGAPRARADAPAARPHRVVFELTSDDPKVWEALLNNIENVQKALGAVAVEVVAHGKGLALLTSARNVDAPLRDRMAKATGNAVVFAACENTMKRQDVKKADLLPFAVTVDAGVAEVVRKQETGWSYVRTGS